MSVEAAAEAGEESGPHGQYRQLSKADRAGRPQCSAATRATFTAAAAASPSLRWRRQQGQAAFSALPTARPGASNTQGRPRSSGRSCSTSTPLCASPVLRSQLLRAAPFAVNVQAACASLSHPATREAPLRLLAAALTSIACSSLDSLLHISGSSLMRESHKNVRLVDS